MTTCASACSPPAPMPCTARQPISQLIDSASPAIAELTTKITIAIWTSSFLSNRSASLPQIGVDAVVVSRVAVTTQVYWVCEPCRSEMIVGQGVGDDRRRQDRDEHREQEAAERLQHLALAARRLRGGRGRRCGGRRRALGDGGHDWDLFNGWSRWSSRCGDPRAGAVVEFVGKRPDQPGRGPHVVVRVVGEGVVQPGAPGVGGFGEQLATGGRELDEAGAAVGGVAAADDEPARLQLADLPADDRLADAAPRRELAEPQLTLAEEQGQLEGGKRACDGVPEGVPVGPDEGDDGVAERVRRVRPTSRSATRCIVQPYSQKFAMRKQLVSGVAPTQGSCAQTRLCLRSCTRVARVGTARPPPEPRRFGHPGPMALLHDRSGRRGGRAGAWTALVLGAALLAGGCTASTVGTGVPVVPSAEPSVTAPPGESPATQQALPLYYVTDTPAGPRLAREFRRLPVGTDPGTAAVAALLADPPAPCRATATPGPPGPPRRHR